MSTYRYKNFVAGISIINKASTGSSVLGDLEVLDSTNKIYYYNGTVNSPLVTEVGTATLTNKTLTAPIINNATADTITGIGGAPLLIRSATNQDLNLTAQGTGNVNITGTNITFNGSIAGLGGFSITGTDIFATVGTSATFQHNFVFNSGAGNSLTNTNALAFAITSANNQNLVLTGSGTGTVDATGRAINLATTSNGDINITPNGSGVINLFNLVVQGNAIENIIFDSATNSITGDSASAFLIQSSTNQNLNLKALGTGIVVVQDRLEVVNPIQYDETNNSSATGANQDIVAPASSFVIFTNASLTSIRSIVAGNQGQILHIKNGTTGTLTLVNEAGAATAANRITTGTAANLLIPNTGCVTLLYDTVNSRWSVIGFGSVTTTASTVSASNSGHTYLTGTDVQTQLDQTDAELVILAVKTAPTIQKFTSGSGTYTTPTSPAPLYLKIKMVGGGQGGQGSGTSVTDGANGGNTTFGTTLLVAGGGNSGTSSSLGSGPIGIALNGGTGSGHGKVNVNGTCFPTSGTGAASFFGGAGGGGNETTAGNAAITNSGSGGGGGGCDQTTSTFSGSGGNAGGFVDAIITTPNATYSYVVGTGGAGGAAGTNGTVGGNGGSGVIIVEEYYQ